MHGYNDSLDRYVTWGWWRGWRMMRTPNKTREHNPTVTNCTKNAAVSGTVGQTTKRNDGAQDLPTDIPDGCESTQSERTMGMVNNALKGSVAAMMLASRILEATRTVMYGPANLGRAMRPRRIGASASLDPRRRDSGDLGRIAKYFVRNELLLSGTDSARGKYHGSDINSRCSRRIRYHAIRGRAHSHESMGAGNPNGSSECYRRTTSYPSFISPSAILNPTHTQSINAAPFATPSTNVGGM